MFVKVTFLFIFCGVASSQKKVGDPCVEDYTNSIGVCVPTQRCESAKIAFEKNGIRPTFCMYTFDEAIVCCRISADADFAPSTPVPSAPPPVPSAPPPEPSAPPPVLIKTESPPAWGSSEENPPSRPNGKRISEKKCDEYSRYGDPPTPDFESEPNELIVGGVPSDLNEFPHMVAIGWLNFEDTYSFNCGGSLISSQWVMTAGHCTSDPTARERNPSMVRLGDLNIDPGVDDGANPEEIPIQSIIRHPSYDPPLRYHDIALIKLARPAELTAAIHPACLWMDPTITHSEAIAIGWGVSDVIGNPGFSPHYRAETRQLSKILQKVTLTLQDSAYCDRLLYVNRNRNWSGFSPGQLCAGELRPGKDTCQGDSGAPLQVKWRNTYRIVGITSFGLNKCAESGRPAVYTRVSSYVPWIESVVWPEE